MSKGTPSQGMKSGKITHVPCRRCGKPAYHVRKKRCASCGYGETARVRKYAFLKKHH